jgi:hypothetical protein
MVSIKCRLSGNTQSCSCRIYRVLLSLAIIILPPVLGQRCNGTTSGLGYLEVSWHCPAILSFVQSISVQFPISGEWYIKKWYIQFLCSNSSVDLIWNIKLINSAIASQLPDCIKPSLTQQTSSEIMYFSYTEMYSYQR